MDIELFNLKRFKLRSMNDVKSLIRRYDRLHQRGIITLEEHDKLIDILATKVVNYL